ncbi:MAG: hypothetical protein ACK4XM_08500 [Chloroherpetonaceae bacterium]
MPIFKGKLDDALNEFFRILSQLKVKRGDMMRFQRFCSVFLLATSLLTVSMLTASCYTQFATTNSIERISSPSEVDVEELVENGSNVTINNNYYDPYYAYYIRPAIYGFSSVWSWYDPFWGYPLWYTPVIVPIGVGWGWSRWRWNPYFLYWGSGGVASTERIGTRRIGIGRTRDNSITNTLFPTSSSPRAGSSSDGGVVPSNSRRQRESTTSPPPADASRRSSSARAVERKSDGKLKEQRGSYSVPSRRQSSGEQRLPSYSTPIPRSSSPASAPSRSGSSSSSNSSSGSLGRRQR